MGKRVCILIALFNFGLCFGQEEDLWITLKNNPRQDTVRVKLMLKIANNSGSSAKEDSLADAALSLSEKIGYERGKLNSLIVIGYRKSSKMDYAGAKETLQQALIIAKKQKNNYKIASVLMQLGGVETGLGNHAEAIECFLKCERILQKYSFQDDLADSQAMLSEVYTVTSNTVAALEWGLKAVKSSEELGGAAYARSLSALSVAYVNVDEPGKAERLIKKSIQIKEAAGITTQNEYHKLGEIYISMKRYSDALASLDKCIAQNPDDDHMVAHAQRSKGAVHLSRKQYAEALLEFENGLKTASKYKDISLQANCYSGIAEVYLRTGKEQDALRAGEAAYSCAKTSGIVGDLFWSTAILHEIYAKVKNYAKAYELGEKYHKYSDSISNSGTIKKIQLLEYNQKIKEKQSEIYVLNKEKEVQKYLLIGGIIILVLIVLIVIVLLRNNRQRHKAYMLLESQKQVIEHRESETLAALTDLKQTQNQLIQSEKMASLGQLTAGIAHEIQNPLNFVNNFSDVSAELLQELREEADKGDLEEVKAIADDVVRNLEKIAHHGKRADSIVKGMLEHSRTSTGHKEPADVNALADEYLRLAYHGLRAKDKSFNAELITSFDENLPKVNVIPQDIGRVLLNLFTNAFYAVQQKQSQSQSQFSDYKPSVTVPTKHTGNTVNIIVNDNGTGIPDAIKDKILQPFFTTKPTGEGTGLGLSLSYDIVVKGHGGSIYINSKEGEGSEFIITLPL